MPRNSNHRSWAVENMLKQEKAWKEWFAAHPFQNESDPDAQRLLQVYIGAYMLYLDAHPDIDGKERLDSLVQRMERWTV